MKVGFVYFGLLSSFIEKNIPLEEYEHLCDLDVDLICIHRKSEVEDDLNQIVWASLIELYTESPYNQIEDYFHHHPLKPY